MRVLIVEDDKILRDGLADLLRGAGYSVEPVSDGALGLRRAVAESFDLILLDLALPGLDGIEVCQRLRLARPAVPILMLTARGSEDDKVRGLNVGADDYVTKPFGARELLARVEALGRRATAAPRAGDSRGPRVPPRPRPLRSPPQRSHDSADGARSGDPALALSASQPRRSAKRAADPCVGRERRHRDAD